MTPLLPDLSWQRTSFSRALPVTLGEVTFSLLGYLAAMHYHTGNIADHQRNPYRGGTACSRRATSYSAAYLRADLTPRCLTATIESGMTLRR